MEMQRTLPPVDTAGPRHVARVLGSLAAVLLAFMVTVPLQADDRKPQAADEQPKDAQKQDDAKKEDAKPAAGQPKPAAPANPLGKLFRKLFPNRGPNAANPPQNGPAAQAAGTAPAERDHVDARAPHDSTRARVLRQAELLLEKKQWDSAVTLLQRLLEQPGDHVIRTREHTQTTIWRQANRLLARLPQDQLQRYELQYGAAASHMARQARDAGDLEKLAEVASRFQLTRAGQEAAANMAALHLDRGEFGMAARWLADLAELKSPVIESPVWRLRYATALKYSGREALAGKVFTAPAGGQPPAAAAAASDLLARLERVLPARTPASDRLPDWPMFFGSASHRGRSAGGMPLLLQRWSVPTTYSHPVREAIESISADLEDAGQAAIPAWFPLMVDGKVIFRTFRGVQVVDAATGDSLWETRPGVSPELILSGQPPRSGQPRRVGRLPLQRQYVSGDAQQMPLTSLLHRNGAWGVLNSDGRRLYVLEQQAVLSRYQAGARFGGNIGQNDAWRRDWETNLIAAYDLKTGRPVWEAGGTRMNESFDLKLAGTWFFGPPVPDDDDLFAVGEKDSKVELFALDALTGRVKWSWPLAMSDSPIDQDIGRRWWTAQPAVAGGVIVCPTTMGWLVAVDRTRHTLLWADRYSKPGANNRAQSRRQTVVQATPLNDRWYPSPPVIEGHHVVYAPPEEKAVYCWDLFDGSRVWQKSKGQFLYLAGVFDGQVVLVGMSQVEAIDLKTGKTTWTCSLRSAKSPPSGFGIASGTTYHLPLQSGQLWSLDLATGKVQARSWLPKGSPPLGNLAFDRGMLISLGPLGLTSFEHRETYLADIQRKRQTDAASIEAATADARIHLLHREYDKALAALDLVDESGLTVDSDAGKKYRQLLITCLVEAVQDDLAARDEEFARLRKLADELPGSVSLAHLTARRHEARGELADAFRVYAGFANDTSRYGEMVTQPDSRVRVSFLPWLAGQLGDLWQAMDEPARASVEALIESSIAGAEPLPVDRQRQIAELFRFHPAAVPLAWRVAEQYSAESQFAQAENILRKLTEHSDQTIAAESTRRLVVLLRKSNLPEAAERERQQLATRFAQQPLADGKTGSETATELGAPAPATSSVAADGIWGRYDLRLEKSGNSYSSRTVRELASPPAEMPWFNRHRLLVYESEQRMAVYDSSSDALHWLAPLRSAPRSSQGGQVASQTSDHLLYVLNRDVLHCMSPVDRRILWKQVVETTATNSGFYRRPSRQNDLPLVEARHLASRYSLATQANATGMLAVVNRSIVCLYGRRRFSVYDSLSGDLLWQREGTPADTRVYGTTEVVFVVPGGDANRTFACRATDGKQLDISNVGDLVPNSIGTSGRMLLQIRPVEGTGLLGLTQKAMELRQFDPTTGRVAWKKSIPGNSYVKLFPDNWLMSLTSDGKLESVNLHDGEVRFYEGVLPADLKDKAELHAVADADQLYLIVNRPRKGGQFFYSDGIPVLRVNGPIIAFNRREGRQLWKKEMLGQSLVRQQMGHTPFLVFATRILHRKNRMSFWKLRLAAIDRQTGRSLIDLQTGTSSSFRSMHVNMDERWLQLESYNQRIRLYAVEPGQEAAEAGDVPVEQSARQ